MTALGRVIGGKYRMLYPLGRGGMGAVWVGEHVDLEFNVAVKFIDPRLAADEQACKRFRREAQAAASLKGRHVVQVFDYGIDKGDPYIVMELLEGRTLADRLDHEGRLPIEEAVEVVSQMARALGRAHEQGIVHRDLKPDNVFLVNDDPGFTVKLLDFGVAKVTGAGGSASDLTQPGHVLGTLQYMSPEQLHGMSGVDAKSDVWAFGIVVFECLTGRLPLQGLEGPPLVSAITQGKLPRPSEFAEVPPGFDVWFASATDPSAAHRASSVKRLAEDFSAIAQGLTGVCALRDGVEAGSSEEITNVIAYSSSERREEQRSSSIPAAINGRRDINHIALIAKISETSAVLWTRHRARPGQSMRLSLHFDNESEGYVTLALVRAVDDNQGDRPEMWPFEVTVQFAAPMAGLEQKIGAGALD